MKAGTYKVLASGHGDSKVPLKVTLSDKSIEKIDYDSKDVSQFGKQVFKEIPRKIIENQSFNIDTVSGATLSSNGIINAVKEAIKQAGGDPTDFNKKVSEKETSLEDGSYSGSANSVGGPLKIEVGIKNHQIDSIKVNGIHDTPGVGSLAAKIIPKDMIANQSIEVDTATGASLSSLAIKSAVRSALDKSSKNIPQSFTRKIERKAAPQTDQQTQAVVVGGGIAGMCTLERLTSRGIKTILVEKNAMLGGDALVSDQACAIDSSLSDLANLQDTINDYHKNGIELKSNSFDFFGNKLTNVYMNAPQGKTSVQTIIDSIAKFAKRKDNKIYTETTFKELINENGRITGIIAQPKGQKEYKIKAQAVILATGGYANNAKLVAKYLPYAQGAQYAGMPNATGTGLLQAIKNGASTQYMNSKLTSFYAVNKNSGFWAEFGNNSVHFIGNDGSLITKESTYNIGTLNTYKAIGNKEFYTVSTQSEVTNGNSQAAYDKMITAKTVKKYKNANEAAKSLTLTNLIDTLNNLKLDTSEPIYIGKAIAAIYGTYGGVKVNTKGEVLNKEAQPIDGLFASGEISGSYSYQKTGNYLGGIAGGFMWGSAVGEAVTKKIVNSN